LEFSDQRAEKREVYREIKSPVRFQLRIGQAHEKGNYSRLRTKSALRLRPTSQNSQSTIIQSGKAQNAWDLSL
jgi:hypothetical protein